jgi:hypothetical protein
MRAMVWDTGLGVNRGARSPRGHGGASVGSGMLKVWLSSVRHLKFTGFLAFSSRAG